MKLGENQIFSISSHILEGLNKNDHVKFREKEGVIRERIKNAILGNLRTEEEIDKEVRKLMDAYSEQIEKGEVDSRKAFGMIKSKLAKERGFIL